MNKLILTILSLFLLGINGILLNVSAQESVHVFTDRNSCVSGDTIWFDLSVHLEGRANTKNIVHVVLADAKQTIDYSSIQCDDNWGSGYIKVPDSLSSGVYRLYAYALSQLNNPDNLITERCIVVYNRFDFEFRETQIPVIKQNEQLILSYPEVVLNLPRRTYAIREKVRMKLHTPDQTKHQMKSMIVNVKYHDPLTDSLPYLQQFKTFKQPITNSATEETNGIIVSGYATLDDELTPARDALIFLTIKGLLPHFDYCITDSMGMFQFYLKDASGLANLILQTVSDDEKQLAIHMDNRHLLINPESKERSVFLKNENITHISNVIEAAKINRIFNRNHLEEADTFRIEKNYKNAFYGQSSKTIYPKLFFDLPNFTEISRELLYGVYYRFKNEVYTLRMQNRGLGYEFSTDPLILIDGVPVFDPGILFSFNSKQIQRIELVFEQRFFGDLKFNGVMALYTHKNQSSLTLSNPNMIHYKQKCVQLPRKSKASIQLNKNTPDFRKVLYRQHFNLTELPSAIEFTSSDLKGDVIIEVTGIGIDNTVYYQSEKIIVE